MTPSVEEHARAWEGFSRAIMLVLSLSMLAALAVVALLAASQFGGFARREQGRKAASVAEFLARTAFVPVSLEDRATLARAAAVYLADPDIVHVEIDDADGRPLYSRTAPDAPGGRTVSASREIAPPAEAEPAAGPAVGRVTVEVSLRRVLGTVHEFVGLIAAACLLLLAAALSLAFSLTGRMTRRLRELIGEAALTRELQRSNQELEQFAYVASHDLQAPLRTIVSYSQILEKRYHGRLDADADRFLGTIIGAGTRMRRLIQDLLAYSRVGRAQAPLSPVDAAAVARAAAAVLQEQADAAGGAVVIGELPVVLGDSGQLQELFENLIGNALKFRGVEPPRVEVSAQREGSWWRLSVRDNGIGFEPGYREKIFEMFQRLHSQERFPGTGIGLAICKKIVERHGGRIWAQSEPGKGSVFYFTLRAAPPGSRP